MANNVGSTVEKEGTYKCTVCGYEFFMEKDNIFPPCCKGGTFTFERAENLTKSSY